MLELPFKLLDSSSLVIGNSVFYSIITHFNKKFTVTRCYIFCYAWESTSKNLPEIQLDMGIVILNIFYYKTSSKFLQVDETCINNRKD